MKNTFKYFLGLSIALTIQTTLNAQCNKCTAITAGFDGTVLKLNNGVCATLSYETMSYDCVVSDTKLIDTDGDGIVDIKDACPRTPGVIAYRGCPEPDEVTKTVITNAMTGVQFETGSAVITTDSYANLDKVADLMKSNDKYNLYIIGNADNVGVRESNMKLSEERAKSCKKYIVRKGVRPRRISTDGNGELNPIADNATETGRQINRNVEFVIQY